MTVAAKDSYSQAGISHNGPSQDSISRPGTSRPPAVLLRRVPRQERGRERVERILDAAAAVIAKVGVEAATTNAIAAQAVTSVGSLYQFFPNKEAIVQALAARYNSELRRINEEAMRPEVAVQPVSEIVERVITPLLRFHQDNPAYRHVYHAMNGPDGPSCGEAELHETVVTRLEALLKARTSGIPPGAQPSAQHIHATVAVLTAHALLGFAMTVSEAMRDGIVNELKILMVSYIEDTVGGRPTMTSNTPSASTNTARARL